MHRFHIAPEHCSGPTLTLRGGEAYHAVQVLRVQRGERVIVLDGVGDEFSCEVRNLMQHALELEIIAKSTVPPLPCQITLLQSITKGKTMDSIIQKATELGVFRIVPILSERVVVRLDEKSARNKTARWQHVAVEAIKQCGSAWLPKVELPSTPEQFIARKENFELPLVGSLQDDAHHLREGILEFQAKYGRMPESACIWIGPEGDFTYSELNAIEAAGSLPITLGALVLRVETASVYCLSILNYELQAIGVNPGGGIQQRV